MAHNIDHIIIHLEAAAKLLPPNTPDASHLWTSDLLRTYMGVWDALHAARAERAAMQQPELFASAS